MKYCIKNLSGTKMIKNKRTKLSFFPINLIKHCHASQPAPAIYKCVLVASVCTTI